MVDSKPQKGAIMLRSTEVIGRPFESYTPARGVEMKNMNDWGQAKKH